jgi:hypothetical protein
LNLTNAIATPLSPDHDNGGKELALFLMKLVFLPLKSTKNAQRH